MWDSDKVISQRSRRNSFYFSYKSDGFCILGYGFDSKRLLQCMLLLLLPPRFGKVCDRDVTCFSSVRLKEGLPKRRSFFMPMT